MERISRLVRALFSRKWWWVTLLVLVGMALFARLGIWQLDRLAQRRAANAILIEALNSPPLLLNSATLPPQLSQWQDRQAMAEGRYDLANQMALKVQNWNGRAGIHLLTPLLLEGQDTAVLVDRGWIPDSLAQPENWAQFDESGPVSVDGYIALSQSRPPTAVTPSPTTSLQREWYRVDLPALQTQLPYELLPIYLIQSPPPAGNTALPFRQPRDIEISEGSHLGYAGQWFLFSLLLGVGYVIYVDKSVANNRRPDSKYPEAI
jgi:surfeit locus 1 family protein